MPRQELFANIDYMLTDYIAKQLKKARYELIEDGTYFGEIPGLVGVWANAKKLEDCRAELQSVLEDWILFTIKDGGSLPGLPVLTGRRRTRAHA